MKIVVGYPKNWDKIKTKFNFVENKPFILTIGDILYNPFNLTFDRSYLIHEETHSRRQLEAGLEIYFKKYFDKIIFRFMEELIAYQNQYLYCKENNYDMKKWLNELAGGLSSPEYGFDIDIEYAKDLIQGIV